MVNSTHSIKYVSMSMQEPNHKICKRSLTKESKILLKWDGGFLFLLFFKPKMLTRREKEMESIVVRCLVQKYGQKNKSILQPF